MTATPAISPTLAAEALVVRLREEGRPILHMGFGEAPFPAPPRIADALRRHAEEKAYLAVAGLPELRRVVAEHQHRLCGIDPESIDVLVGPGSKLLLYAAQMVVPGDLLLPTPSWVSYRPQAHMLGQQVLPVPVSLSDDGYVIDPGALDASIVDARATGRHPAKLLLNYPNNPSGLTIPRDNLQAIAEVCRRQDIVIISDEIYGRLAFDGDYRSISTYAPERTIVTTGLSKHLSLGGWRLGVSVIPRAMSGLFDTLVGIASETWSCVAAPVQFAAIEAYAGHTDIETFIETSSRIHAGVTRYVATRLRESGAECAIPQGGFYAYPDFGSLEGIDTSAALANALVEEAGLVSLPGTSFGEDDATLRLRLSTCDYDGAQALRECSASDLVPGANVIARFAPRVIEAMDAFDGFVSARR